MKNLFPIVVLVLFALACGRFQGSQSSNNAANGGKPGSDDKPAIRKIVDVPALYGKTKDEVIKGVAEGKKKNDFSDWMDFEFPEGTLRVGFTKDKADNFKFTLPIYGGDFLVDTPENLGTLTGIALAGKAPDVKLEGFISYEKESMGGTRVTITLDKKPGSDRFYSLAVRKGN